MSVNLRDGKYLNSPRNINVSRTNTSVVLAVFRVVDATSGAPVPGATCIVDGGDQRDAEGNYILGAAPASIEVNIDQSTTKRVATVVTEGTGRISVRLATATWSLEDCAPGDVGPFVPQPGTLTVRATAVGYAPVTGLFPYLVFDGAPLVGDRNGCG